jgi:protein-L-isoaspartate(D-aspartate) O-methyltransferase
MSDLHGPGSIPENRLNALERLRAHGVCDRRVQNAVLRTPSELFPLDAEHEEPPWPSGGAMATALADLVALMVQALELRGDERVLDVGTGSGYQAALLSGLAREVYTVEIDPVRAESARSVLSERGCHNVTVIVGDGSLGWPAHAPYQGIILGAALPALPPELVAELAEGGRLVAPVGGADGQLVRRWHKRDPGLDSETLGWCALEPLLCHPARPSRFPWVGAPRSQRG